MVRRWRPTPSAPTLSLAELLSERELKAKSELKAVAGASKAENSSRKRKPKKKKKKPQMPKSEITEERVVVISNMVLSDELEDPDERVEVENEVRCVLERHGELRWLDVDSKTGKITAHFSNLQAAKTAVTALNVSKYGSRVISARIEAVRQQNNGDTNLDKDGTRTQGQNMNVDNSPALPSKNKRRTKLKRQVIRDRSNQAVIQHKHKVQPVRPYKTFAIHNLLDPAELDDEDEFEDIYAETTESIARFGKVVKLDIIRDKDNEIGGISVGNIVVVFERSEHAAAAFKFYDGKVFGGRIVSSTWVDVSATNFVVVEGMLDPKELEDPDEYDDIVNETRGFFSAYDQVSNVEIDLETTECVVECVSSTAATKFAADINSKRYGGRQLMAYIKQNKHFEVELPNEPYGEDCIIVVDPPSPVREVDVSSSAVTDLAVSLLKRLGTLQERVHVQKPLQEKSLRRLVLGLHEVRRGILQGKVKLLIIGTDIEAGKALDEKVIELIETAKEQDVPFICPMSRRKLGRVLKKNVRVSCVGVYSIDGANDIFRDLLKAI